jgi:phosphopantothenoylcysteine synthetase/decarboxylase
MRPRIEAGQRVAWLFIRAAGMLVVMAQKSGLLSVVVSGAAPVADVSTLVKQALERGWAVQVIATPSALAFFDAAEVEALTGSPVRSQHRAPGTPRSQVPDAIVVAPATFNLLNQWALGIADSYALAVLAEQTGMGLPIVVLPAVSAPLASRPQFARSVKVLRGEGVSVLLGPGGTAPPGATEDAFPWQIALDEAFSMTGFGG